MSLADPTTLKTWQADLYSEKFQPSQYTAVLVQEFEAHALRTKQTNVLDVGLGSGVLLAAAARLQAGALFGVDINPEALEAAKRLLQSCASGIPFSLFLGDMWEPIPEGTQFSTILANLPHFPGSFRSEDRPSTWAGSEGREIIDRFISGLPCRLDKDGVALMTHHDLIGFQQTERLISSLGMSFETSFRWTVFEPPERMLSVSEETVKQNGECGVCYGGYSFMSARVLKIFK